MQLSHILTVSPCARPFFHSRHVEMSQVYAIKICLCPTSCLSFRVLLILMLWLTGTRKYKGVNVAECNSFLLPFHQNSINLIVFKWNGNAVLNYQAMPKTYMRIKPIEENVCRYSFSCLYCWSTDTQVFCVHLPAPCSSPLYCVTQCCDCDLMIASSPPLRDVNRENWSIIMKIIDRN